MKFGGKEARLWCCLWLFGISILSLAGIVDDHCKRRRFDLIRLSLDSKSNFFLFVLLWEGIKRSGKEKDNCFFTGEAFSLKGGSGMGLTLSDLPIMGSKWLMTSFLLVFLKIERLICFVFHSRNNKTNVTIMCQNDELSSTMSWVGCLLKDLVLPDTWKLRGWE